MKSSTNKAMSNEAKSYPGTTSKSELMTPNQFTASTVAGRIAKAATSSEIIPKEIGNGDLLAKGDHSDMRVDVLNVKCPTRVELSDVVVGPRKDVDAGKTLIIPAVQSLKIETLEAEADWAAFNSKRHIQKILAGLNSDNLNEAVSKLEKIVGDAQLSSKFVGKSEVELVLDALISKCVGSEQFLTFGPLLINMVAERSPADFKTYFLKLMSEKQHHFVQVSASDAVVMPSVEKYCHLLARLITFPRNTETVLSSSASAVLEECLENWTYPDGIEVNVLGLSEMLAEVHAHALSKTIAEIQNLMPRSDTAVSEVLKKVDWFLRETTLNGQLPRKLRELYLEILLNMHNRGPRIVDASVQGSGAGSPTSQLVKESVPDQVEHDDDDQDVIVEDDGNQNETPGHDSPELPTDSSGVLSQAELLQPPYDQYICVSQLLLDLNMEDQLSRFKDNFIRDSLLASGRNSLGSLLQEAGFPVGMKFEILNYLESTDVAGLRRRALELSKTKLPEGVKGSSKLHEKNFPLDISRSVEPLLVEDKEVVVTKGEPDMRPPPSIARLPFGKGPRSPHGSDSRSTSDGSIKEARAPDRSSPRPFTPESALVDGRVRSADLSDSAPSVTPTEFITDDHFVPHRDSQSRGGGVAPTDRLDAREVPASNMHHNRGASGRSGTYGRLHQGRSWRGRDDRNRHWRDGEANRSQDGVRQSAPNLSGSPGFRSPNPNRGKVAHAPSGSTSGARADSHHWVRPNWIASGDERSNAVSNSGPRFTGVMPRQCLRCHASDHTSDNCQVANFFYG